MKTFPAALAVLAMIATTGLAKDDLGPIDAARSAWPDAFVPGKVASIDRAGEALFAFAGEADVFFPGESESNLREEAVLDAKANFFAAMTDGDRSRSVRLSGMRVAYHWREGDKLLVLCVAPRGSVTVSPPAPAPVAPAPASGAAVAPTTAPTVAPALVPPASRPAHGKPSLGPTPLEDRIRSLRKRLADNPDDPLSRLELSRIFVQTGETGRAVRHYEALARKLTEKPDVMTDHEAAAAMVEAAEYAKSVGNEAKALKFYRVGWRRHDPELQQRITTAISLLLLHVD